MKVGRSTKHSKVKNLTLVADRVNIVNASGGPSKIIGGGGVQAPKRQYQFSHDVAPNISVTSPESVLPPPPMNQPEAPSQIPSVANSLGRIGQMLGSAAASYASQALWNRASADFQNWMFNSSGTPNTSPTSPSWPGIEPVPSPTSPSWPGIEPVPSPPGISGPITDLGYSSPILSDRTMVQSPGQMSPGSPYIPPSQIPSPATSSPRTPDSFRVPSAGLRRPNLPPPINTQVGPDSAGLTPASLTPTPSSGGPSPGGQVNPPYSVPSVLQRVPGGWYDSPTSPFQPTPGVWNPGAGPMMTEINMAVPDPYLMRRTPTAAPQPGVYRPEVR